MNMITEPTSPEVSDPVAAKDILVAGGTVAYAPGDGYLYGVALVKWETAVFTKKSLIVQGGPITAMTFLRFDEPTDRWEKWDHHRWERHQHPESVYAGLMPLLAAFGWAGDRRPVFDREAVREFE